jgi:hypothetical protein
VLRTIRGFRLIAVFFGAALLLASAGCLQVETRVKLHEDGSATITERVQFSKRLLEFRDPDNPKLQVARFLEKSAVIDRMKHMGKGIQLKSHTIRDAEKGARECVSVFTIPSITDLRYVSPLLGKTDYTKDNVLICKTFPLYSSSWSLERAGYMTARWQSTRGTNGPREYKGISPEQRQLYRQLRPVFADMLRGFQLKFVFECYAPAIVRRAPQRDAGTRTHLAHLIDVSGDNLDRGGSLFVEDEEAMAQFLQGKINAHYVRSNCDFSATGKMPLFRFGSGTTDVMFRPSKYYFDKYFQGKTLNFGRHGKRKASFAKDGYHPEKNRKGSDK